MACAYRHLVDAPIEIAVETTVGPDQSKTVIGGRLEAGQTLRIVKFVAYHSSTGVPAEELADRCHRTLDRAISDGHDAILDEQRAWLERFWADSDIELRGRRRRPAGRALEPVPAGPGQSPRPRSTASPPKASPVAATRATTSGTPRRTWCRSSPTRTRRRPASCCGSGGGSCRQRPRAGRRAEPGRRAVPVAHDQRRRGVGLLRRRHRAVPHQRGDRLRPQALPRRQRGHRLPRRRGRRDPRRDGPAVGGPRVLLDERLGGRSASTASPVPTSTRRSSTTTCTRT